MEVAIWRTMKDERVRPQVRVRNARGKWKTLKSRSAADHLKMEGKAIVVGDKFELEKGVFAECPGMSGTARNDCNCRCFLEHKLVTIEEAAKLTGKSEEDIEKIIEKTAGEEWKSEFVDGGDKSGLEKIEESGIIKSGARITDPLSKEADLFAKSFYEEVRHRTTDCKKIANNIGVDEKDIEKIKKYLFVDKSLYDNDLGMWRRFDEDFAIAHSWQRLTDGKT